MRRLIRLALVTCAAVAATTCGSDELPLVDDPCDPSYLGIPGIGPAGGTWQNTSVVQDAIQGFRVTVPPGRWTECWQLEVTWQDAWVTPDYPAGFASVSGPWAPASIAITIFRQGMGVHYNERTYAPDSMYVELGFPLHTIPADARRFLGAFSYDDAGDDWRIHLPDDLDADFLTIRTRSWRQQWSWGRIDPAAIDFDRYVAPAIEGRIGTAGWSQIRTVVDSIAAALAASVSWPIDCNGLDVLEVVLGDLRDQAEAKLRASQDAIPCGSCDVFTSVFWDEWKEYVRQQQTEAILGFFTGLLPAGKVMDLVVGEVIQIAFQCAASRFACDYDCFWGTVPPAFYWYLAEYGISVAILDFVEWYRASGYTWCSAAPTALWSPGTLDFTGRGIVGPLRSSAESR